jgi:adenylate cyclase
MIFSLQRRFLVLLLLPVALIVVITGVAGFCYSRNYLLELWIISIRLNLDKAAHQITMKLNEKLGLIDLISKAEETPERDVTQAFLIQQLAATDGVRFVDIDTVSSDADDSREGGATQQQLGSGMAEGLYTMEICSDFGFCAPVLDPNALDRSMRIVKILGAKTENPPRRLTVRIRFDSFLEPIQAMGLDESSFACLTTSSGQFLAHTVPGMADRKRLGDNGDQMEKEVLQAMRRNSFGMVFGQGHPPDWVVGFHRIPEMNWYILIFSRGDVVMAPIVRFRFFYALAGLASLIVIVLLIRITTRSVGSSVAAISAAAAQVRAGDYSVHIPEDRNDEIGELKRGFNRLVEGLKRRDLIEQTFGRYVDKSVAEELMSRPEALRLGGELRTVTIMMSDLREFTSLSEMLKPEEIITMLNRYFSRMISVIEKYRGIIVDFYGDSILVFFDGIESDVAQRAFDAVKCAMEMQRAHLHFVQENLQAGLPLIMMGIGIHTGEVVVGNIGTESRAKYGIVGSNVNLTDRIQSTASGGKVVISEQTYEAIGDKATISSAFKVCLKGVQDQKKLYEVESVNGG